MISGVSWNGSQDLYFRWKPFTSIQFECYCNSSYRPNEDPRKWASAISPLGVPDALSTGSSSARNYSYQRPALYKLESYNRYYDSI